MGGGFPWSQSGHGRRSASVSPTKATSCFMGPSVLPVCGHPKSVLLPGPCPEQRVQAPAHDALSTLRACGPTSRGSSQRSGDPPCPARPPAPSPCPESRSGAAIQRGGSLLFPQRAYCAAWPRSVLALDIEVGPGLSAQKAGVRQARVIGTEPPRDPRDCVAWWGRQRCCLLDREGSETRQGWALREAQRAGREARLGTLGHLGEAEAVSWYGGGESAPDDVKPLLSYALGPHPAAT